MDRNNSKESLTTYDDVRAFQRAFAQSVLTRDSTPVVPWLAPVTGSPVGGAWGGMRDYTRNTLGSLVGVIEGLMPRVAAWLGETTFRGVVRDFVVAHPPRDPVLYHYGVDFPEFLEAKIHTATAKNHNSELRDRWGRSVTGLQAAWAFRDLARLEWAVGAVALRPIEPALTADSLKGRSPSWVLGFPLRFRQDIIMFDVSSGGRLLWEHAEKIIDENGAGSALPSFVDEDLGTTGMALVDHPSAPCVHWWPQVGRLFVDAVRETCCLEGCFETLCVQKGVAPEVVNALFQEALGQGWFAARQEPS